MSLGVIISLIFLVLKIAGYIDWGWFLIILPIIIEVSIYLLLTILLMFKD